MYYIFQQLADFRDKCSRCFVYDWITVPLVYTQVISMNWLVLFEFELMRMKISLIKHYCKAEYNLQHTHTSPLPFSKCKHFKL